MSRDLQVINSNVLSEVNKNGVSSVIKPLTKEIQLFDCFVSEIYDTDKSVIAKIKIGDEITTKKDEKNLFDEYAVALFNVEGEKIGYIPELYSSIVNKLISAGKVIKAKIEDIDTDIVEDITIVKIDVYLVDF